MSLAAGKELRPAYLMHHETSPVPVSLNSACAYLVIYPFLLCRPWFLYITATLLACDHIVPLKLFVSVFIDEVHSLDPERLFAYAMK